MRRLAVVGSGAWGTALAVHAARRRLEVSLWARSAEAVQEMRAARQNLRYLPGVRFPEGIEPAADLREAVSGADAVIVAVPSHGMRETARALRPHLPARSLLVSATKGIETDTLRRMSEVLEEECAGASGELPRVCVISGPSFAQEVVLGHPTAVVVASLDTDASRALQEALSGENLRLYTNDDVLGVEIGGAFKNVIAIAAGTVEGLGLGWNTLAALITRGLAEISRLGLSLGARPTTLSGLAGMGDLVLTCTGALSRNRQVGVRLGRGESLEQILATLGHVAEGVRTTPAINRMAAREGVELPIAAQVGEILRVGKDPRKAIRELMERNLKGETQ